MHEVGKYREGKVESRKSWGGGESMLQAGRHDIIAVAENLCLETSIRRQREKQLG